MKLLTVPLGVLIATGAACDLPLNEPLPTPVRISTMSEPVDLPVSLAVCERVIYAHREDLGECLEPLVEVNIADVEDANFAFSDYQRVIFIDKGHPRTMTIKQ